MKWVRLVASFDGRTMNNYLGDEMRILSLAFFLLSVGFTIGAFVFDMQDALFLALISVLFSILYAPWESWE
jgi:hypothetical protein